MRKREVWMKPDGDLVLITWNPCGCHPNDVIKTWGKKWGETVSYLNNSKRAHTKSLFKRGWERLDVQNN